MKERASCAKATAIIANWNGAEHLKVALASLSSQSFDSFEVLVVDNGSTDESHGVAKDYQTQWIPLEKNFGLAYALNVGAAAANGDVLIFLNNDMRFHLDFVKELVGAIDASEDIFAADSPQRSWNDESYVHLATQVASTSPLKAGLLPLLDFRSRPQSGEVNFDVPQACAAAMAVRKEMFQALGGFDSRFKAGWEDSDICWRAWKNNWRTVFVPTALCWHRVAASSTSGEGFPARFQATILGRFVFSLKHLPLYHAVILMTFSLGGLAREVFTGRWRLAGLRVRSIASVFIMMPQLLRERWSWYKSLRAPSRHLKRMIQLSEDSLPIEHVHD